LKSKYLCIKLVSEPDLIGIFKWILMRSKSKQNKGTLEDFNPEIQREFQKWGMESGGDDPTMRPEAMMESFQDEDNGGRIVL